MAEPHEVLDVAPDAEEHAVRSAYRDLLTEHHPDQGGSREQFLRIKRAYERLVEDDDLRCDAPQTIGCPEVRTAEPVRYQGEPALRARGAGLEVHLLALTDDVDAASLLPDHVESGRRVVACFAVRCRADRAVTWSGRRVRFVDERGERHPPSVYRPRECDLPGAWRGDDVELEPAERVRSLLVSRELPETVALRRLAYEGIGASRPDRGLRFELDERRRAGLDRTPF